VTIPAAIRARHGLQEGDEVEVIEDGTTLRIVRAKASTTRGQRLVARMRGRATTTKSTEQLLELLRDE
jgi:AbrB family looped-hinge helix DNA binding protein